MRVLVTRPSDSAKRTAQKLIGLGHEPVVFPVTEPFSDPEAAINALEDNPSPLVITSAQAVRALAKLPDKIAPHYGRPVFAVGEATAEAARKAGFIHVDASHGSGAELAEMLNAQGVHDVLYLAGQPRAGTLEARATELGIKVNVVESYAMRVVAQNKDSLRRAAGGRLDAVLLYSAHTAQLFFAVADGAEEIAKANVLCLSAAVASKVPPSYQPVVKIAQTPDEGTLLSLL
ncbi:uroporphyrinogen-III synthase [Oryzifoliimicrobium ureilyticus]|uniref:uroporphyrinogen-III synthase n=1 Tax=Oryzifoliimicrobium ureilyticus TaxID=3113724 RepID=UPI00307604D0